MTVLYRSPLIRWLLSLAGLCAGLVLIFGDGEKWRSAPSLHWLAQAPIPLQAWGAALVLYALLLLFAETRPLGYALGAVVYALFTLSLIATLDLGSASPKNAPVLAGMVDVVAFHVFSIRTAWAQRLAA